MNSQAQSKGPWITRFSIRLLTLAFAVLVFWLLGFIVKDIRTLQGPDFGEITERHIDQSLLDKQNELGERLAELDRQIKNKTEQQKVTGDSSRNLQQTINQLLELQKIGIEKNIAFSEAEQENFANSLNLFLENQKDYQGLSQTISQLLREKHDLEKEKQQIGEQIGQQRIPAKKEYDRLMERHRLTLAFYQLAILIPLLIIAGVLVLKKRESIYFLPFLAFGASTLLKVAIVIHEYFPTRYFKYILILFLLLIVLRILVYLIGLIAFPKKQWLIKQYREAYERFLCPVCEYPIRIGPRKFLFWTRRSVKRICLPDQQEGKEETYTCPSCGTTLFEECVSCHNVRHSLLPNCHHCGALKNE